MVIGRIIRLCLNAFPRPILQRFAAWSVPVLGYVYRGHGRKCPICGKEVRKFLPYGYTSSREDALCPRCLSLERHRMLWLFIERQQILESHPRLLHMAPEAALKKRIEHIYLKCEQKYITADLESPLAKMHFDICNIPLESKSVECFICNHLLEHVSDDRLALRELRRILSNNGIGIMLSPVDKSREKTFEDPSITNKRERSRIFGQYDHVRIYGMDFEERVRQEGFLVKVINPSDFLDTEQMKLYSVRNDESIYLLKKQ